jgi:GntR family transcriptional repressor for pyruvate dehydrogenase complex
MELAIRDARRIQLYGNKQVSVRLWEEHEAIYRAVEARDSTGAESAMRAHLTHVEQVLRAYLETS